MKLTFALLALTALGVNLSAADNSKLLTSAEGVKWSDDIKAATAASTPSADFHHWTWDPDKFLRAEIELRKDMMTFRLTNTGTVDQIIAGMLFNKEFLKETLNVEVYDGTPLPRGQVFDRFKLRSDGVIGTDSDTYSLDMRRIAPNETIEVTFNLIEAMKQVNNPKLATYLAKESIWFSIIFPIERVDVGLKDNGVIEFHSPDVIYKLR
jgi:hypothetical protein